MPMDNSANHIAALVAVLKLYRVSHSACELGGPQGMCHKCNLAEDAMRAATSKPLPPFDCPHTEYCGCVTQCEPGEKATLDRQTAALGIAEKIINDDRLLGADELAVMISAAFAPICEQRDEMARLLKYFIRVVIPKCKHADTKADICLRCEAERILSTSEVAGEQCAVCGEAIERARIKRLWIHASHRQLRYDHEARPAVLSTSEGSRKEKQ